MRHTLWFLLLAWAQAQALILQWDPVTTDPLVAGYEIHYGQSSGQYTELADVVGVQTNTVDISPASGVWFFVARSRNDDGTLFSEYSNEVSAAVGPDLALPVDITEWHVTYTYQEGGGMATTLWTDDVTECWDFDNDGGAAQKDGSHDLTAVNNPTYSATNPPQGTHYADFDEADDEHFSLSDDPDFDVGQNDYSLAFWMYSYGGEGYVAGKSVNAGGWQVGRMYTDAQYLAVKHKNDWGNTEVSSSGLSWPINVWRHVVVSYDYSADELTWWVSSDTAFGDQVDGSTSAMTVFPEADSTSDLFIGGYSATLSFNGALDEFAFFSGKVLNATEAEEIYNGTGSGGWREATAATSMHLVPSQHKLQHLLVR